jgi:hypothetical protein
VWGSLREGYGVLLPVFLGALVLVPVLALVLLRSRLERAPHPVVLSGMAAGTLVGLLWCLRDFDSWPDTYPLLPSVVVGVGGAAWLVERRAARRAALVMVVAWTVVALVLGTTYALSRRNDLLQFQRDSVAAALRVLPGARITSIGAPEALVMADQRNPSRHQMTTSGLKDYIDATWPGGFQGFVTWTRDRPQELVAVWPKEAVMWQRWLAPRYERVGTAPGITWFVATSVDPLQRERLHEALRAVHRAHASG